jgi:DNA ligase 1
VASFYGLAEVCELLSQTSSRFQMAQTVGEFLGRLDVAEAEIAARFMVGRALAVGEEKKLNVSGRAIWKIAAEMAGGVDEDRGSEIFASAVDFGEAIQILLRLRPAEPEPTLTIAEVSRHFEQIASIEGRNSRRRKLDALRELFERASALEGKYIAKILIREMRHGMSEGLMLEAIALMGNQPASEIRRIHMLEGDVGRVVRALRAAAGTGAQAPVSLASAAAPIVARLRPLKPMLAAPAQDVADAFAILGTRFALEHKLDGARVQIHRAGGQTRVFSRRLNEITASVPEVVERAGRLGSRSAILDGEVIAVAPHGKPLAFQEVMRRFGRVRDVERLREELPLRLFVFDLIALDDDLLIDRTYEERYAMLSALAVDTGLELPGRIIPASLAEAEAFYKAAIDAGYEGVMAKALESRYTPGVRGRGWLKIKRARTLDLVIVAADWGYGRRKGWLSNYHLAARDDRSGEFHEVGKTFKGLTDEEFRTITERLLSLKIGEQGVTVFVRPELVVEVAYSDIQKSPQYGSAMALRFARIVRIRDDESAAEADTIATLRSEYERQLVKPA